MVGLVNFKKSTELGLLKKSPASRSSCEKYGVTHDIGRDVYLIAVAVPKANFKRDTIY